MSKHPGFKKVAQGIAQKEGVSQGAANAILASSSRKASPAAKKANPRLAKVNGEPDADDQKQYKKGAPGFHAFFKDYMKQPGL